MSDAGRKDSKAPGGETITTSSAAADPGNGRMPRRGSNGRKSGASSSSGGDSADRKLSTMDDRSGALEQSTRRRSSMVAPSSGGNDQMNLNAHDVGDGGGGSQASGDTAPAATENSDGGTAPAMEGEVGSSALVQAESEEAGYLEVVAWVKKHLVLPDYSQDEHWREGHDEVKH